MKIAVAAENSMIAQHFGHCEGFKMFTVINGKIINKEFIPNLKQSSRVLANYLNNLGINVIISNGIGGGAIEIFCEKNIKVIIGASGDVETIVKDYLEGKIKSEEDICCQYKNKDLS